MNAALSSGRVDTNNVKDPAPSKSETGEPAAGAARPEAGRDNRGRFTCGNKGGPGNPFARRTARLRSILLETVSDEDMRIMAQKLVEQAKAGDLAAMKLLFGYVIGKPIPCADPDRLDVDEWQLSQEAPGVADLDAMVKERLPADLACKLGWIIVEQNKEEALCKLAEARVAVRKMKRSTSGIRRTAAVPSANGHNGRASQGRVSSNGHVPPSLNGNNGNAAPSANGGNGAVARSPHLPLS